jgi:hypothetical protein
MSSRELCIMACIFCREPQFHQWLAETTDLVKPRDGQAKAFILRQCQVSSRNDLDTDPDAAARFHDLVRKPFLAWKEERS